MNKRISLVIGLMTLCTAFLLGLQFYWNYAAYQSSVRVFKSDINDALDKSVNHLMDLRRDEFAARYKTWLADTNLVIITAKYLSKSESTQFTLRDKHPLYKRSPFYVGFDYKQHIAAITPDAKTFFIDQFTKDLLANDLKNSSSYYYTQSLGDLLSNTYKQDRLNIQRLENIYRQELRKRDIRDNFDLKFTKYTFKGWSIPNDQLAGYNYSTRQFKYGFHMPQIGVNAYFINPNLLFFQKMKWVLLSSLLLIAITIGCYTYTVKTMLSQKKLAQLKDDFVNNMTHELKTPIATISVAAEAIQDFNLSKVSADEYLSIIRYQASNLTSLIDQILKSIVNDQGIIGLNRELVCLTDIVNNCIHQYQPQLQAKEADLNIKLSDDLYIIGDAIHIGNIVANLLDNAIKYGSEKPVINIEALVVKDWINLSVSNNGPSIPAEYREKIFDRFFRVPSGNVHNVKGYGLGLSYVQDVIQQHGGSIKLTSISRTTTFTIKLPLATHEVGQRIIT
jgi:two-component system phosphate regulon sensor histidine kinase PhoR